MPAVTAVSFLRSLSPRAELALVTALAFGWLVVSALANAAHGTATFTLSPSAIVGLCAYEVVALVLIGTILGVRGWRWRHVGLVPTLRNTAAGVGLIGGAFLTYWLWIGVARLVLGGWEFLEAVRFERTASLASVLVLSVLNPVFEEGIVVGYVVRALERHGAVVAITASALLRMLYHVYQGAAAAVYVGLLGLLFATSFWRRRDLWRLMVAHAALDLMAITAMEAASG